MYRSRCVCGMGAWMNMCVGVVWWRGCKRKTVKSENLNSTLLQSRTSLLHLISSYAFHFFPFHFNISSPISLLHSILVPSRVTLYIPHLHLNSSQNITHNRFIQIDSYFFIQISLFSYNFFFWSVICHGVIRSE